MRNFRFINIKHKLPEYTNSQMKDMIMDKIHDRNDRKIMLQKMIAKFEDMER